LKAKEELIEKALCYVLLLVVVCFLSWYFKEIWRLTCGDSSIAWVYAKNLAEHGRLLEYNLGEKSTGCTSLGHIFLLASVHKLIGPGPEYLYYDLAVFVFYILSLPVLFRLCIAWGAGPVAALFAVGTYVVFVPQAYYSAVSFETPVWLFFVFLMWLCFVPFTKRPLDKISWRTKMAFAVVAAVQTSYRPEGIVFTAVILLYLLWYNRNTLSKHFFKQWTAICFVSVLPLLYLITLNYRCFGTFTGTSSMVRLRLILFKSSGREYTFFAKSILNEYLNYWLLLVLPAIAFCIGGVEFVLSRREKGSLAREPNKLVVKFLVITTIACLLFFFIFTFKYKVHISERYAVPFVVTLCVISGLSAYLLHIKVRRHFFLQLFCWAIVLCFFYQYVKKPTIAQYHTAKRSMSLVPPDAMFEEDLVAWLHENTHEDDYILVYEVQMKYLLDRRVLDFDGILSGKSLPYFRTNLWHEFLQKYRPNIWVANPAVFYRKDMFLPGSLFHRVIQAFDENGGIGQSRELSGIEFTLIKRRKERSKTDYAEYTHVFMLNYL